MTVLYETQASVTGGREGTATLKDSDLTIKMVPPGSNKEGNNPEQLFAMGYAACFDSALNLVKSQAKAKVDTETQVSVALNKNGDADFGLSGSIHVVGTNTDLSADELTALVEKAHTVCPYSKATKGNVEMTVSAEVQ